MDVRSATEYSRIDLRNENVCHILAPAVVNRDVSADSGQIAEVPIKPFVFNFEAVFHAQYSHVARVITSVVRDPAKAEDMTAEVFWRLWRNPQAHGPNVGAWLHRTAVRIGLDELRKQYRREKYERLFRVFHTTQSPEEVHLINEERRRVHAVLVSMRTRDAELLLLRVDGQKYSDIAQILGLNATSIGTLLARAQHTFRREYIKRYGDV